MKNARIEAKEIAQAPLPLYTLSALVGAFALATGLSLWHGDVAAVLALFCLCPMTLIPVVAHSPEESAPAALEIRRARVGGYAAPKNDQRRSIACPSLLFSAEGATDPFAIGHVQPLPSRKESQRRAHLSREFTRLVDMIFSTPCKNIAAEPHLSRGQAI